MEKRKFNKSKQKIEKIKIKICPKCNSKEIEMVAGGITGTWRCKKCKFTSPIFPEKIVKINEKGEIVK